MKITKQELIDGLAMLDPTNEAHWTEDGQPTLSIVQDAVMDDTVTREDIAEHANGFSREIAAEAIAEADEEQVAAKAKLEAASDVADLVPPVMYDALPEQDPEASRQALQANVLSAKQALEDFDKAIAKAKLQRDGLVAQVDKAVRELELEFPPVKPAEAVQNWIASEAAKRAERANIVMQSIGSKSPIDASMQRRTGYGGGRKFVPLLGQG